jgi:hypothetical protein
MGGKGSGASASKAIKNQPVSTQENVDELSDLSTSASEGRLSNPSASSPGAASADGSCTPGVSEDTAATSAWTSVPVRKKPQRLVNADVERPAGASDASGASSAAVAASSAGIAAAVRPTKERREERREVRTYAGRPTGAGSRTEEDYYARQWPTGSKGKGKGKGKGTGKGTGLPHFRRIEVGIEDDRDFRIVQRLIGPRGKYMQDISVESGGAKVWIIGRGSRSWEDDVSPLMVCVGATSSAMFDCAVGLVNDLLESVRVEHGKFHQ